MRAKLLRAPFPWFGGKSRVAHLVWERFGEVRNFVEPFFGSGAVLLGRPGEPAIETVNDADAYLSNFWRAVAADPDGVARWADWPVNEADLHARHRWLVESAKERIEKVKVDPDFFDAKVAGWWVWGQCLWIGSGWCARPEWTGRAHAGRSSRGINGAEFGKLPAIAGRGAGRGACAKSRHANGTDAERVVDWNPRPDLSAGNNRGGIFTARKRPALTHHGGGVGVQKPSLGACAWRQAHQIPSLRGDSGATGQGIVASGFLRRSGGLQAYMQALSDRLRRVRVCCGDFERILGPAVTTCIGLTGVFLDPPYPEDGRAICYSHDGDAVWWRAYQWAIDHANDPLLRIALCGYEHVDAVFPPGWTEVAWKASGGYGRSPRGKANALRERIWFSPGCLTGEEQLLLP